MELKVSSPRHRALSPADCVSDPEEKEISDEDDDDRNHKHRRRETRSQSLERDGSDQVLARPYRKRNKNFENGHSFRENESQASEAWRHYNVSPLEKDLSAKFERRRPGLPSHLRGPLDQRIRATHAFLGDTAPGRGRGRDLGSWNQRDSRFGSIEIASQMIQPGPMVPNLFGGRGLPNVSTAQSASWTPFGILPGIPNGGLDTLHPIGLQGTLRPPINSSLNIGIPRQRCRDFEERGFCLRGDMCPMEHGVNRIVVEDVQSLSQFNLPVSLPSAQLLGPPAGPGPLPSVGAPSTLINNKGAHTKGSKPGLNNDGLELSDAYPCAAGADFYDPDQPLWNNNGPETAASLAALQSPKIDGIEPSLDDDRHHGADSEYAIRSIGTMGSQGLSVWGRIGGSKSKLNSKEKIDVTISSSDYLENEAKVDQEPLGSTQSILRQGKRTIADDAGPKVMDSSLKTQSDAMRNVRKSSQKALRTLFVNGIPLKSNKRESLLSHFQKFGEVIDIYIPLNSERAFVQFSKREEAEAALKSPEAVMGNRFIKLWWANRDSIPDDGVSGGGVVAVAPRVMITSSVLPHQSVAHRGKDILQPALTKGNTVHSAEFPPTVPDLPKPVIINGPKAPPQQKKLETLEQLKEELRKKQEMLDQKRNDFRKQLDKFEKQAIGPKGELVTEQAAKRLKVGVASDVAKASTSTSSEPVAAMVSPHTEMFGDKNNSVENVVSRSPKSKTAMAVQETTTLKPQCRSLGTFNSLNMMNRYKLDNRPATFRIIPPLPIGFADVAVLKEHFSSFGDLSTVELEDLEAVEGGNVSEASKNFGVHVTFRSRQAAERAFVNGRCWEGHDLQFTWEASSNSSIFTGSREKSVSTPKGPVDAEVQPAEKSGLILCQEAGKSGNKESEKTERKGDIKHTELHEISQPNPNPVSGEKAPSKVNC